MHRNYQKFDYWKLLFLMEISRRGFINETLEQQRIEEFSEKLKYVGFRLRKGINISPNDGKPKTDEIWLPAFREMDDLISKMKSTDVGRRIYNTQLLKDWEEVKKYSYFAKNRHSGMIKVGHWGAYRKLSEFTDLEGKL